MKGLSLAIAALLILAAPARADFSVTPSPTQAGASADVTLDASFAATPTRVALHLPPGLVGNPNAAPRCAVADFLDGNCGAASQVGTASASGTIVITVLPVPITATGAVYNLAPQAGEPARLGIDVAALGIHVYNQASVSLRPDGGLDSTIAALDKGPLTSLDALSLTLSRTFMRLPTSCGPATTTIEADTTQSASFTPTGCASVPFDPSVSAALETTQRVVPSGATVTLAMPAGQSDVRRAQITLPEGTTLSPGVANGLVACTAAQFAGPGCPDASQVGTVSFVTPLLGTLPGKVYFGDGFKLYVVVAGSGVKVALAGDVALNPANGQITTTFDNLPQVPFSSFSLSFQGGARAVLANPASCGTKTLSALLTPWSGTAPKTATATFTIDADGRGGACAAASFAPSLSSSAASTLAGRPAGAVTLAVANPSGSQDLARVTTLLPPGLAGSLKGVPVCPEANANAGTCPAATRVGSTTAEAGTGDAPVPLNGTVFLTGPYDGGLAGLAIAIPGKVGPVDLGTVVVRAGISLRPDGGLTVRTSPLPSLVGGVPVSIRRLALTLDRPGFILNSSSCAPQSVTAVLEGSGGAQATVSAPYQATDCAGLRFTPQLQATLGARGRTASGAYAPLRTVITVPNGQSSTASAKVTLPKAIGVDLQRLAKACAPADYAAGACPATSVIGAATAATPLLASPLTGPVSLAVASAGSLPGLALKLSGPVTLPLFGAVGLGKSLETTFAGIPDVPLERFELSFTGGRTSPLRLSRDICTGARQTLAAQFAAHNGAQTTLKVPVRISGCPPVVSLTRRHGRVTVHVKRGRDAPGIKRVTLDGKRRKSMRTTKRRFRVVVTDASGHRWTFTRRR